MSLLCGGDAIGHTWHSDTLFIPEAHGAYVLITAGIDKGNIFLPAALNYDHMGIRSVMPVLHPRGEHLLTISDMLHNSPCHGDVFPAYRIPKLLKGNKPRPQKGHMTCLINAYHCGFHPDSTDAAVYYGCDPSVKVVFNVLCSGWTGVS